MKLEYINNRRDRAIAAMVNVRLEEKRIILNTTERETLRKAQQICEKAQELLVRYYQDADLITDYSLADHALSDILEV